MGSGIVVGRELWVLAGGYDGVGVVVEWEMWLVGEVTFLMMEWELCGLWCGECCGFVLGALCDQM